jgi:hypothetical protein
LQGHSSSSSIHFPIVWLTLLLETVGVDKRRGETSGTGVRVETLEVFPCWEERMVAQWVY